MRTWLPTADSAEAAGRPLVDRPDAEKGRDWRSALARFTAESDRALDLFASFMPEVRALDDSDTLPFLPGPNSPPPPAVNSDECRAGEDGECTSWTRGASQH